MKYLDKNGDVLFVGAVVDVPCPTSEDQWNFDFTGTITEIDKDGYCVVEDGDGDCWCVESERLELS